MSEWVIVVLAAIAAFVLVRISFNRNCAKVLMKEGTYIATRERGGDASLMGFGKESGRYYEQRTVSSPTLEGAMTMLFSESSTFEAEKQEND